MTWNSKFGGWVSLAWIFEDKFPKPPKSPKTFAFFTCFERDLKLENLLDCSKIIRVQYAVVFVLFYLKWKNLHYDPKNIGSFFQV